MINTQ